MKRMLLLLIPAMVLAMVLAGCARKPQEPEIVISSRGVEIRGELPCVKASDAVVYLDTTQTRNRDLFNPPDPRLTVIKNDWSTSPLDPVKALYRLPAAGIVEKLQSDGGIDVLARDLGGVRYERAVSEYYPNDRHLQPLQALGSDAFKLEVAQDPEGPWYELGNKSILLPLEVRGRKSIYVRVSESQTWPEFSSLGALRLSVSSRDAGVRFCDEKVKVKGR